MALSWNIEEMFFRFGVERLGFLTLTFKDPVMLLPEASKRFNSLATHVLNNRYSAWLRIAERQKSGRVHYHLLVAMREDIRTGFDFEAVARKDYRSAGTALRDEWAFWRATAPAYRFGRTELLPIMSNVEAMSKYVGKYLSKGCYFNRRPEDRGQRLIAYSQGWRIASVQFAAASKGHAEWRRKCAMFARLEWIAGRLSEPSWEALSRAYGPRWAYRLGAEIIDLPSPAGASYAYDKPLRQGV
jgi:hypothetical protein